MHLWVINSPFASVVVWGKNISKIGEGGVQFCLLQQQKRILSASSSLFWLWISKKWVLNSQSSNISLVPFYCHQDIWIAGRMELWINLELNIDNSESLGISHNLLQTFNRTGASLSENILFSTLGLSPNSKTQRLDKFILVKLKLKICAILFKVTTFVTSCTVSSHDSRAVCVTPFSYLTHVNVPGSDR